VVLGEISDPMKIELVGNVLRWLIIAAVLIGVGLVVVWVVG